MAILPFNDPVIERIAAQNSLPEIKVTTNLFVDLVEDIVAQQLSSKVADTIFKRFCNLFPDGIPTSDSLLQKSHEQLRAIGLSNAKANYVKNIAQYFLDNDFSVDKVNHLTDEEIVSELIKIKGVGVWTAQMVLIFSLNRPNVFPYGDLAIQQGMNSIYNLQLQGKDLVKEIAKISENWQPYRTIGTRYVWLSVNLAKKNGVRL
jgi:DNA-3-methyladenine glycosylase II